jgi:hypothetical protein
MIIRLVRHINTKRAFKSASLGRWGGILQEDSDHKNIDKNTRLLSTVGGNMSSEDSEEMIEIGDTDLAFFGGVRQKSTDQDQARFVEKTKSKPNKTTIKIDFTVHTNDPHWPFLL